MVPYELQICILATPLELQMIKKELIKKGYLIQHN